MSMIKKALTTLIALAATSLHAADTTSNASSSNSLPGMEKCYGIAKAGINDCSNGVHQCAGEAQTDGDKTEWLSVPQGLCNKIVGGSLKPTTNKKS